MSYKKINRKGYSDEYISIDYDIEVIDNEELDTRVVVLDNENAITLCHVAGSEREKFDKELGKLLGKYKI